MNQNQIFSALRLVAGLSLSLAAGAAYGQETATPTALSETYGGWVVRCQQLAVAADQPARQVCEMDQELRQKDSNQHALTMVLALDAESKIQATILAPFGLDLSTKLKVDLKDQPLFEAPYKTCLPRGCVVRSELTGEMVTAFGAAKEASVAMIGADTGQEIRFALSTEGFNAAWARLVDLHGG